MNSVADDNLPDEALPEQPDPTPHAASNFNAADDAIEPTGSPIDLVAGGLGGAAAKGIVDAVAPSVERIAGNEVGSVDLSGLGEAANGVWGRVKDTLGLADDIAPEAAHKAVNEGLDAGKISPQDASRAIQKIQNLSSARAGKAGMADGGWVPPSDGPKLGSSEPAPNAPEQPDGVPIYDISGPTPVFGHINHDEVHDAVASGKYSLPKGGSVPAFAPDGTLGDISAEEAPQAFNNGYKYATPGDIEQHDYGTVGQQAASVGEGVAKGLLGPLAPAAEIASGLTTGKNIEARERVNPWESGGGEALGLVGGALTGTGEGALLEKAGAASATRLFGSKAPSLLAKIGARGVSDATQMAIYQGGNEVSKLIENDPNQTIGSAMADVGLSGLIGGVAGTALGTVSPLWEATVGSKLGKIVDDFKGRLDFLQKNPEPAEALAKELSDHYSGITSAADEVYGPSGLKAQGISKALPEMSPKLAQHAQDTADQLRSVIDDMKAKPDLYPSRLVSKLESDLSTYERGALPEKTPIQYQPIESTLDYGKPQTQTFYQSPSTAGFNPYDSGVDVDVGTAERGIKKAGKVTQLDQPSIGPLKSPQEIFNALQDLKQKMQSYSKFDKIIKPTDDAYDFVQSAKTIGYDLRTKLENPELWGKASETQQKINKAFSDYLPTLKDFEAKFTSKVNGDHQIDPGKVATYINQTDKASGSVKKQMLKNFLDASEKYKNVIDEAHASIGSTSPIQNTPLNVANSTFDKTTAGAKLADYFVKHGVAHLAGEGLGTGIGAAAGHAFGIPGIGAIIGERALGPLLSTTLPSIVKPVLLNATSSKAFKAALDVATAAYRGNSLITKTAKNLFKGAGEVLTSHVMSDENKRNKLDSQLQAYQQNPDKLLNIANNSSDVGRYLPNHAAAISQQSVQAINYLNNLRPKTAPSLPLDSKLPVNPVAKAAYNNALDIANQPLVTLHKINKGTLTPQDVAVIKNVHPGAYQRISQKLTESMMDHVSKGNTVPYKLRQGISLFLGQPMDSTMTQPAILSAQPMPPQPQPATATTPPSRPKTSTSKLGNTAKSALTGNQARQMRQDKQS